ncbi:MAG: RidA family protein [Dehalococcoidales bacterium]|nr:RidA family protein [Dehalococcoidales bacterium]MDZ4230564.1 RidA family protein [Dehalococcoidales bacterium]
MKVERINPDTSAPPRGYSHVVKTDNTVYIAGQVARDRDGKTVGVGDARAQVEQVFKNLEAALNAAGGDLSHIVKTNIFMTHREDIPAYRETRAKYFSNDNPPVSTLILCSGLADPDFRIEIEAIAVVP